MPDIAGTLWSCNSVQQRKVKALINVVSVHGRPLQPAGHECDFQRNERLQLINRNLAILVGVFTHEILEALASSQADHPDNIQATHWWCNGEKGSTRMDD